jgi:hypothetical protein
MEQWDNPVCVQDNYGNMHNMRSRQGTVLNSHIIDVDTRARANPTDENAGFFQLELPQTYKNVYSIEMLNAIIGIPEPTTPDDNPCLSGTQSIGGLQVPPALYLFVGKGIGNNSVTGTIKVIEEARQPQNQGVSFSIAPSIDGAFCKIPTISLQETPGTFFFRKTEYRLIKRYQSPLTSLSTIGIQLRDYQGRLFTPWNPSDPLPGHIFSLQFEIVSQN